MGVGLFLPSDAHFSREAWSNGPASAAAEVSAVVVFVGGVVGGVLLPPPKLKTELHRLRAAGSTGHDEAGAVVSFESLIGVLCRTELYHAVADAERRERNSIYCRVQPFENDDHPYSDKSTIALALRETRKLPGPTRGRELLADKRCSQAVLVYRCRKDVRRWQRRSGQRGLGVGEQGTTRIVEKERLGAEELGG